MSEGCAPVLARPREKGQFTAIPVLFAWLDPDEQRERGHYLVELTRLAQAAALEEGDHSLLASGDTAK